MRGAEPVSCFHSPQPRRGTAITSDGRPADLFNTSHYPVRAACQVCAQPIRAESFFRPFEHVEGERLAEMIPFPGRRETAEI